MIRKLSFKQGLSLCLAFAFLVSVFTGQNTFAQELVLPIPGTRVPLSSTFNPPILKGIKVHPDNPFRFDFIVDQGDKEECTKLIKYFLASLTTPENDMWVNLSPYEKNRIIPESFGLTEMGRDLLAQDYMLKQITASLIYPEDETGKRFWKRVYEESMKKFGTTNIQINTFNKVWIIPERAIVYENAKAGTAYVVESKLKVMLEEDYLAMDKNVCREGSCIRPQTTNTTTSQIVREVVLPELTKEINEGKNFTQLRQVYNSLILATWYKKKIKDSIINHVYSDRNKVAGVNINDPQEIQKIYERYLKAFKKGAYNYIKVEPDSITQQATPRKYFAGGMRIKVSPEYTSQFNLAMTSGKQYQVTMDLAMAHSTKFIVYGQDQMSDQDRIFFKKRDAVERKINIFLRHLQYTSKVSFKKFKNMSGQLGEKVEDEYTDITLKIAYAIFKNLESDKPLIVDKLEEIIAHFWELMPPIAHSLPAFDDWLAFALMGFTKNYLEQVRRLAKANRPWACALLFAANGPHTRGLFIAEGGWTKLDGIKYNGDDADVKAQYILINGFSKELNARLVALERAKSSGDPISIKQAEDHFRPYAGALLNGLMARTQLSMGDYFEGMQAAIEDKEIDLRQIVSQSLTLFTGEQIPSFLHFVGAAFGNHEIQEMAYWAYKHGATITAGDLYAGSMASDVETYRREIENKKRMRKRLNWQTDLTREETMESIASRYQYLRAVANSAMLSASSWAHVNKAMTNEGGIDFKSATVNEALHVQSNNDEIRFHLDPAMLQQFQNTAGFIPVIIDIQPVSDLKAFLTVV